MNNSNESSSTGDWKKSAITGGIIGICVLVGAVVIKGELPIITASANDVQEAADSQPKAEVVASAPSVPAPPAQKTAPAMPSIQGGNATVIGKPGYKNIRSGPTTRHAVVFTTYPGNRLQIAGVERNSEGHPWYKLLLTNGQEGWIAGQLVKPDGQQSASPTSSSAGTNATVVGEPGYKNVRSGPGTNFREVRTAHPGDRVRILRTRRDASGHTWHEVSFPESTGGWIAGQLISRD